MGIQRVRIDASLHPVSPIGHTQITSLKARYQDGCFDHLAAGELSRLAAAIRRADLLDQAYFNQELNKMLRQYGMWVTNISSDLPEYAVEYLTGYQTREALLDALRMRNWFIPAASSMHVLNPFHLQDVDEVLGTETLTAC